MSLRDSSVFVKIVLSALAGLVTILWFGALGPYCMSSRSDVLVVAWPITTVLGVVVIAAYAIHLVSSTNTEKKG